MPKNLESARLRMVWGRVNVLWRPHRRLRGQVSLLRDGGAFTGARRAREEFTSLSNENPCQLTPNPRPCSPTRLVTGALHRVKRETGESCALLKAMSVRCCPRNGKRAKRQIHCASSSAWEGDACRFRLMPKPL